MNVFLTRKYYWKQFHFHTVSYEAAGRYLYVKKEELMSFWLYTAYISNECYRMSSPA